MDDPFFGRRSRRGRVGRQCCAPSLRPRASKAPDTRFAFYFPDALSYTGRFIQSSGQPMWSRGKGCASPDSHELPGAGRVGRGVFRRCNTAMSAPIRSRRSTITAYPRQRQSARTPARWPKRCTGLRRITATWSGEQRRFALALRDGHVDDCGTGRSRSCASGSRPTRWVRRCVAAHGQRRGAPPLLSEHAGGRSSIACEPGGGDPLAGLDVLERRVIEALFTSGFQREALSSTAGNRYSR